MIKYKKAGRMKTMHKMFATRQIVCTLALLLMNIIVTNAQSAHSDSLYADAVNLAERSEYRKALDKFMLCAKDDEVNCSIISRRYSTYPWMSYCLAKLGDHKQAAAYSHPWYDKPYDRRESVKADSLLSLALVADTAFLDKKIALYIEAERECRKLYGEDAFVVAKLRQNESWMYEQQQDWRNAIDCEQKVYETYRRIRGGYSPEVQLSSASLLSYYNNLQYTVIGNWTGIFSIIKSTQQYSDIYGDTKQLWGLEMNLEGSPFLMAPAIYERIDTTIINRRFFILYLKDGGYFDESKYQLLDFYDNSLSAVITGKTSELNFLVEDSIHGTYFCCQNKIISKSGEIYEAPEGASFKNVNGQLLCVYENREIPFSIKEIPLMGSLHVIFPLANISQSLDGGLYVEKKLVDDDYLIVNHKTGLRGVVHVDRNQLCTVMSCKYQSIGIQEYSNRQFYYGLKNDTTIVPFDKINQMNCGEISLASKEVHWEGIDPNDIRYIGKEGNVLWFFYYRYLLSTNGKKIYVPAMIDISQSGDMVKVDDGISIKVMKIDDVISLLSLYDYSHRYYFDYTTSKMSGINLNCPIAEIHAAFDYPSGNTLYEKNIRQQISENLSDIYQTETLVPDYIAYNDYTPSELLSFCMRNCSTIVQKYSNVSSLNKETYNGRAYVHTEFLKLFETAQYITYQDFNSNYAGGGHGYWSVTYMTYSKKTGKALTLLDIIKENSLSHYRKILVKHVVNVKRKKERENSSETESVKSDEELLVDLYKYDNWKFSGTTLPQSEKSKFIDNFPLGDGTALSPEGLIVTYHPYGIDGYSRGCYQILIPYEELKDILKIQPMYGKAVRSAKPDLNKRGEWTGAQIEELRNMAESSASTGDAVNAIKYARKYNSIIKKTLGNHNPISYRADFWLAKKTAEWGNVRESLDICLRLADEKLATPELYTFISELYFKLGNNVKARDYQLESLKLKEDQHIRDSLNNNDDYQLYDSRDGSWYNMKWFVVPTFDIDLDIMSQCNLSVYEDALGNFNESIIYAKRAVKNVRDLIFDELRSTTSSYQSVEKYIQWYNTFIPTLAAKSNDDELISNAYEALVATKNIQLNTEVALKQLIMNSNDTTITNYYKKLEDNRKAIQALTIYPNKDSREKIASLVEYNTALEDALVRMSLVYGDYKKSLNISVADIVSALHDNEVAIEFAIINGTAGPEYVALLLRRDSKTPILVKLCRESDISLYKTILSDKLSDCLWSPLIPYLKGISTVFFSPSGLLYSIGMEYLPIRKDGALLRFNDVYNIFRVSSTREVAIIRDKSRSSRTGTNTCVLYGGLNYNLDVESMENDSREYAFRNRGLRYTTNFKRMSRKRSLFEDLPGTKAEIESIANYLKSEKREVLKFEDDKGTESSFKSLSGIPINMIHIATHGFYLSKEDIEGVNLGFVNGTNKNDVLDDADMLRSGLLFSGANQMFTGKDIPQGTDDGILTSLEIQSMDLCGVELVVMSACHTAEGELNSDGVFGLQRGFKKAGVKSLLMSLWSVDDTATQILMENFYKNLNSGMTKSNSLHEAQRFLRTYDGGRYDKEEYWAAFILLDAID